MATMPIGVYADEQVNKDYIADLIWEEWWFGTPEDGTQFPEASYEHHLIESWLDENFDEYKDDVPYAIYAYREYYKDLVSNWAFEDDDNGNYYITDLDGNILYHFNFVNGKWNMADENGNVVDSFMPFNTVEWEKEQEAFFQELYVQNFRCYCCDCYFVYAVVKLMNLYFLPQVICKKRFALWYASCSSYNNNNFCCNAQEK